MKNKWTLTLAISTMVIVSLTALLVILGLTSSVRLFDISKLYSNGNNSWEISNNQITMNIYIVLTIFALSSVVLSAFGLFFHKRMETGPYQLWFYASIILSLAMSFGVLVQPLTTEFQTFKNLSDINDISSTATTGLGGNVYAAADKTSVVSKTWELIVAYGFAIKAAIAACAALLLVGSIIMALREAGFGIDGVEIISEEIEDQPTVKTSKTGTVKGFISSKKLERSLDMVTKAKVLLDSKAISKSEFKTIKERELSL